MSREIILIAEGAPPRTTASSDQQILMNPKTGIRFIGKKRGSKSREAEAYYREAFSRFIPDSPLTGPLRVEFLITFPWLKKHTAQQRAKGWIYCTAKPDEDNIKKIPYDQISRLGIWEDDRFLCDTHFKKGYGSDPGVLIRITEIEE